MLTRRYEMLCRVCTVQVQHRKYVLDYANYMTPTRQHELDHTDHTDHTDHKDHTDHDLSALPGRSIP